ncbi:type II toxin-antitoxin system VapC family toxin [Acidobacteria bacterium ACD]|nr:MAG: PIN domain-containing protein [Acidobacteriota bacterium]MDL1949872.1 type II toxin-antitoxin system VapC family toxin [Acidobacteria bacterium ACD]
MRFWDASAIVPLLVSQASTERVRRLYREDPAVVVWWATAVECESAVSRLERGGLLSAEGAGRARGRLSQLARRWAEVEPGEVLRDRARRLLRGHDLRAADALQLSAAIVASEDAPASLAIACLDDRLAAAARREGFPVLP